MIMPSKSIDAGLLPLCVDLDGTLVKTDLLFECLARLIRQKPWLLLSVPFWLLGGKANLKRKMAQHVLIDIATLPYNEAFLEWLRAEKLRGREIILATAADALLANAIAAHLGLFNRVLASDGSENLKGERKLDFLRREISGEFEYAADSFADLAVWRSCSGAILVNANQSLINRVGRHVRVLTTFDRESGSVTEIVRALRLHQWTKNILIFVPLITSHQLLHLRLVLGAAIGGLLFSLCASAQYVLNDLIDLEADRQHATKARRPFASGVLPLQTGLVLVVTLLVISLGSAFFLSRLFTALLCIYFLLSLSYSLYFKRILLLDVFVLSGLYTFRIIVGHLVTNVPFSVWLLSFAVFLFLSLAFSKRMSELRRSGAVDGSLAGRGYMPGDLEQVNVFGVCSAFLAAVIFILYLQSDRVRELYRQPQLLWLLSPLFLYWISRIWMLSYRGEIDEDPVLFVVKDRTTYLVGAVAGLIMYAATRSWGILFN